MSGASAVIHKQNKLIKIFNEVGAVDSEHAISISKFDIRRSFVFNRMVSKGVFIEGEPGKFYINNEVVPRFREQIRNRAFIALAVILVIAAFYYLISGKLM